MVKEIDFSYLELKLIRHQYGDPTQWITKVIKTGVKDAKDKLIKEEQAKLRKDLLINDNRMDMLVEQKKT